MTRINKTSLSHRETYKYYDHSGKMLAEVNVGMVGVDGRPVTEEMIALLHEMDDAEVRDGWRRDKHPTVFLSAIGKSKEYIPEDKITALADKWYSPETILFPEKQPVDPFAHLLDRLPAALAQLQPQQQWLIETVYYDRISKSEVARRVEVTEAAIRDRLNKIYKRLRKTLSE